MTLPNFIVIGAAKAGTTALYWYLAEHPDVFMSPVKETNFFAYGVDEAGRLLYGDPALHQFPVRTLAEYERLFEPAGDAAAVGEVSPIYLECPQAAGRIHERLPEVRLVCCLRNPVDRAYSDYQMYLRTEGRGLEPARDLVPAAAWAGADSHWVRIGAYAAQLERYYARFRPEQLHVFLFDDLRRDALGTVQGMYRFVGADPAFVPDLETPHNIGGLPASPALERVLTRSALKSALAPWIPRPVANWARRVRTRTMRQAPPLPPELRRRLAAHYREDIRRTARLIGRDLDHWL